MRYENSLSIKKRAKRPKTVSDSYSVASSAVLDSRHMSKVQGNGSEYGNGVACTGDGGRIHVFAKHP